MFKAEETKFTGDTYAASAVHGRISVVSGVRDSYYVIQEHRCSDGVAEGCMFSCRLVQRNHTHCYSGYNVVNAEIQDD